MAVLIPELLAGGEAGAAGGAAGGGASSGMLSRVGSFMGGAKGPASGGEGGSAQKVPEVVSNAAAIEHTHTVLGAIH